MWAKIILLVISLMLVNNIDVPRHFSNTIFEDQGALTWRLPIWLKWWRRPVPVVAPLPVHMPTTVPVVTPEHRPVYMPTFAPMPFFGVRKHSTPLSSPVRPFLRMSTPAPTPTPTPIPTTTHVSSPAGIDDLASSFRSIEREVSVLFEAGDIISPDHYQRLSNILNDLQSKSYVLPEIERIRKMLATLNPSTVTSTGSSATPTVSSDSCTNQVSPVLSADITDFSKIKKITAPGSSSAEGPKGHSFIWTDGQRVPLYAPVAATFDSGSYSKDNADSPAQYLLFFALKDHCNFQFKFDHIDEPIGAIKALLPATPQIADSRTTPAAAKIEFKAGDLLGYTNGTRQAGNWDFGLYNTKEEGVLAQYGSYGMHRYAVCWVDFFSAEKQTRYRNLLEGPRLVCSF